MVIWLMCGRGRRRQYTTQHEGKRERTVAKSCRLAHGSKVAKQRSNKKQQEEPTNEQVMADTCCRALLSFTSPSAV